MDKQNNIDNISQRMTDIEELIAKKIEEEKKAMESKIGEIQEIGESTQQKFTFDHKIIVSVGVISIVLMIYFAINMYQMVSHVGKMVNNTNIMTEQMVIIGKSINNMNNNITGINSNIKQMNENMTKDIKSMSKSMNKMNKNVKSMDKGMKNITTPSGFMNMWRR